MTSGGRSIASGALAMVGLFLQLWLVCLLTLVGCQDPGKESGKTGTNVSADSLEVWSAPFRDWHYHPEYIIPANPDIAGYEDVYMTDVPTIYQLPGDSLWYMTFIGYDGKGYQSFVASSPDLLHWQDYRLAMGYGPDGSFDHGGVVLGAYLYEDYHIKSPRILKPVRGMFLSLYGAYPRQGGYELRPGYQGLAQSTDGLSWERTGDDPILSVYQQDCATWEQDCIYMPWLVEADGSYFNLYNAAHGSTEQTGLALSKDLRQWQRYDHNPVVPNGPPGSFNEQFSSDPKVWWDGKRWVNFFFGVGRSGAHIMISFSSDLKHWQVDPEPLYVAGGNPSGLDNRYAHKISIVWHPQQEIFYMFYCAVDEEDRRGIGLLTSRKLNDR